MIKTYQWECIECNEVMNFITEKSSFVSVPVACPKCGRISKQKDIQRIN